MTDPEARRILQELKCDRHPYAYKIPTLPFCTMCVDVWGFLHKGDQIAGILAEKDQEYDGRELLRRWIND